jgi:hypothetical protein
MKKVTVYLDETIWRAFRIACMTHGTSASQQMEHLIRHYLQQDSTTKESSHDA